jgi:hypothetical protein
MLFTFGATRAVRAQSVLGPSRLLGAAAALLGALACKGLAVDVGDPDEPRAAAAELPLGSYAPGTVIDLGSEGGPNHTVAGFSLPERIGPRRAAWSEGDVSTVAFNLRGGEKQYLVAFLAEPYHALGDVPVSITVNKQPLAQTSVGGGWRAYGVVAKGELFNAGRNELAFQFAKTGRPSDSDPASNDVRDLAVRFEQIQVQPIGVSAELSLGSQNAAALAALGEGWVRDASDRGTGTWTVGERSVLVFHLAKVVETPGYRLAVTARAPRGAKERTVTLSLNGEPLERLTFPDTKQTSIVEVAPRRLRSQNELAFEFEQIEPPAELDPASKDTRPLGLRVFEVNVTPQ